MNPWRWIRSRRWWVQLILALLAFPIVLVAGYVAVRSLMYLGAERDPGVYVPAGANVVLRAKDLEAHLKRIQDSPAWRSFERRVLRDAVVRRELNLLLKENGAPTLDDLEDERKPFARQKDRVIDVLGDDVVAALQVREALPKASFCGIVRLRWLYYLATPFARLALPTETIEGEKVLIVRNGPQEIRLTFIGSLVIASNDKLLIAQALKRQGREETPERPVALRASFEGSPALLQIRRAIQSSGLLPSVRWETARTLALTADVRESTVRVDVALDKAEPLHPTAPPVALRAWAPLSTSGVLLTNTGGADLIAWIRGLVTTPGMRSQGETNVLQALQALDEGGLQANLLPQLQDGMAFVTGVDEREGRSYTAFVMILPAKDPTAAVEALNGMVRKIAGNWGDRKYFSSIPVGEVTLNSWKWPEEAVKAMHLNELMSPTYGAVKDLVVIGNNPVFTEAVVKAAQQGNGFEETSQFRKLRSRLKEEGLGLEPSLAGGFLYPPLLRESLDGILGVVALQMVSQTLNGAQHRAEVVEQLKRGGGNPTEPEIVKAYNEAFDRKVEEQETALRRALDPMNAVKWGAFEAQVSDRGIKVKAAMELR